MVEIRARYAIIMKTLLNDTTAYVNSAALAEAAGASIRTIKNDIKNLRPILKRYGMTIQSRSAHGYLLILDSKADLKGLSRALRTNLSQNKGEVFRYNFERVIYIIKHLLVGKPYYKAEELRDSFYLSNSTLTQDLNKARTLLSKFRLKIDMNLRRGIGITGREMDKRLCIAEYFFRYDDKMQVMLQHQEDQEFSGWYEVRDHIAAIVLSACDSNKIQISPFLAVDLAIHIFVSLVRIKNGHYIDEIPREYLPPDGVQYRMAAGGIARTLEEESGLSLTEPERDYIALHLLSKRISVSAAIGTVEHETMKQCVTEILREIRDNFELDLSDDPIFSDFLYANIESIVLRLHTHLINRNPLLFETMRKYLFATKVAHSANGIIEKLFGVDMDNNEFAYLVPLFNMVINRHEKRRKFKIGFIGDLGMPETIMYYNELYENLPRDIYELVWLDRIHNTGMVKQFSYLICSSAALCCPMPSGLPSYQIRDGNYIKEIRGAIAEYKLEQIQIMKYLKSQYGIFDLDGKTKEEVLQSLYRRLKQKGLISAEIEWQNVFRANEIGNGIVHVQDVGRILKNSGCYVCTLSSPILWEQDIVKILVMIKTKRDGDKDLSALCQIVSTWASSPDKIDHFFKVRKYQVFKDDITQVCLDLCCNSII